MKFKSFMLTLSFIILWILAILLFCNIIYLITTSSNNEAVKLLVPLGVLISAALASISLMKSIHNTNILKLKEDKDKIKNANKYLSSIIKNIQYELSIFDKYFTDTQGLHKYSINELKDKSQDKEVQDFIINFQQSEYNKLFIRNLNTTISSLKNLNKMLEDKDIVYYTDKDLFDTIKVIQLLIGNIQDTINRNIEMDVNYINRAIGLKQYFNTLSINLKLHP